MSPMLAATLEEFTQLVLPVMASPKLDGIRCLIVDGVAMSRNMKPIRNRYVQACLGLSALSGLDGELIVGSPTDSRTGGTVLGRSTAVMAIEGEPDFTFWVFDRFDRPQRPFKWRLGSAEDLVDDHDGRHLSIVPHETLTSHVQLAQHEERTLALGYEGVCYRSPSAVYKHGRSTPREGGLWKLKRFLDGEAVVVSLEEGSANGNALLEGSGKPRRSTKAAGMKPNGQVGTLVCAASDGSPMRLSPGAMTLVERRHYWENPSELVGRTVTWRAFAYGVKDALRHATFQGVREDL